MLSTKDHLRKRLTDMSGFHMTSKEFRKHGKELIDWIADYYDYVESFPVKSQVSPGSIRASLPASPPQTGESFEHWLQDVDNFVMPGITHWQSPDFFAFFPCNASGPGILGDLLSSGLNVQGMMWETSPACTEVESLVLDWLVEMLDLPDRFRSDSTGGGVIQDSASSATLCAILAARERTRSSAGTDEMPIESANRLVAYASEEAHSSVEKGLRIVGISSDRLRKIEADDKFAMNPRALAQAIENDVANGLIPFFVSATVGTTSSNGMDPLADIGPICAPRSIWMHVDAAMSGTAAVCPEYRTMHKGLAFADSYCFNPHKWMFTNFDCDCFYVANRSELVDALSILPEYLRNQATDSAEVIDYRDWQIPLGRRFRALKLWYVIRHYGVKGLQHHIREHIRLAQEFARWVETDDDFELLAPHPLNLVCFAHRGGDEKTRDILERANASGKLYASHTLLKGRYAIRMSIGQTHTELRHVKNAWSLFKSFA
jgi:aromatic-L-amino-acid/L-tryptophan decarboxylase